MRVPVEVDFRDQIDTGDGEDGGGVGQNAGAKRRRKVGEVIVIQCLLRLPGKRREERERKKRKRGRSRRGGGR